MERLPTGREPDLPGKETVASRTSPAAGIDASWPRKDGPPKPEESSRRVKDVRPYAGLFPPLDLLDGGHLLPGLLDLPPGAGQYLAVDRLPVEGVARVDQDGRPGPRREGGRPSWRFSSRSSARPPSHFCPWMLYAPTKIDRKVDSIIS